MSNRPHHPRKPHDPYAAWRHLDGQAITIAEHQLHEDADGLPLGVERTEHQGLLILPSLPEQEDDE